MRGMRRADSSTDLAAILDDGATPQSPTDFANLNLKQTAIKLLTGTAPGEKSTPESPTARLKVLLLVTFVGLHVLNLCTTLTTKTAISRHSASAAANASLSRVQLSSSTLTSVLDRLSSLHPANVDLLTFVAPPAYVHMQVPGISRAGSAQLSNALQRLSADTPLAVLDRFMSAWSRLVGDPVMSKWIVIALGVSVFLNGYLLKGVALGSSRAEAAEAAARILLSATGQLEAPERPGKFQRRHSATSGRLLASGKLQQRDDLASANDRRRHDSDASEDTSHSPIELMMQPRPRNRAIADTRKMELQSEASSSFRQPSLSVTTPSMSTTTSTAASETGSYTPATTVDDEDLEDTPVVPKKPRSLEDCVIAFNGGEGALAVSDEEVVLLVQKGKVAAYALEKLLKNHQRAVSIRRSLICAYVYKRVDC